MLLKSNVKKVELLMIYSLHVLFFGYERVFLYLNMTLKSNFYRPRFDETLELLACIDIGQT